MKLLTYIIECKWNGSHYMYMFCFHYFQRSRRRSRSRSRSRPASRPSSRASMRWDKLTVCEIVDLKKNIHYSVNFISWLTKIILSLLSSNSQKIVFVLKKILQYNLYMFVIHVHTLIVLVFHNSAGLYFYMFLEFFNALFILSLLHARTLSTSICLSIRWLAHSVMPDIVRLNNISTFVKVPTQLLFSLLESAFLFINSICLSYTS